MCREKLLLNFAVCSICFIFKINLSLCKLLSKNILQLLFFNSSIHILYLVLQSFHDGLRVLTYEILWVCMYETQWYTYSFKRVPALFDLVRRADFPLFSKKMLDSVENFSELTFSITTFPLFRENVIFPLLFQIFP